MPSQISWHDNEERARWEAVIGPFHAVARLDAGTGRYMAFLEDNATRGTNHYAPDSFSDAEEAKAWCEAEAARLEAEESAAPRDADATIVRRVDDELDAGA